MSLEANIDIHYQHLSFKKIINYLQNDWEFVDFNSIMYMDNDDFDWKSDILQNKYNILRLLEQRYHFNNPVGITMVTKIDNSGGMFLFYPNENILSIIININRKKVHNTIFTDFSYYINYLSPILDDLYKLQYTDVW